MALGADQALQPHEIVWALRRFVSSTGQESALPPYAPASRADTATRTGRGTTWGWSAGAGLRHHWLLRPLTSLGGSVPDCRRGQTEIPSACVSWPEQPSTPGRAPAVYKTAADRLRRAGLCCRCSSGQVGRPAGAVLLCRVARGGMTAGMTGQPGRTHERVQRCRARLPSEPAAGPVGHRRPGRHAHVVPVAFRCNPTPTALTSAAATSPSARSSLTSRGRAWRRWWSTVCCRHGSREPLGYVARRSRSTAAARRSTRGSTTRSSGSHPAGSWPGTSGTASKRSSTVEEARILDVPRPRSGRGRGLVSGSSQEVLDDERRGRWGAFDEPEEGAEVSGGGEPW